MYWTLELASKLEDAPWPATKEELIDYGIRSGAPLEVIENLQEIEDEGEMYGHGGTARHSKQQLFNVSTLAQSLHDRLHDDDELPEWVQSSLAVIEAKLIEVAGHLEYKIHRKED